MLHDYQERAFVDACAVLDARSKALFVAPTGSGKSYIQAAVHDRMAPEGLITVAPSTEILLGIYERRRAFDPTVRDIPEGRQQERLEASGLWTVMRLHNALLSARIDPPRMLQFDEAHHTTASSYETLHALCGDCPAVAWTATGFRGTPDETAKLRAKWGSPRVVLTLKQAVQRGVVARPDMRVWPLLNDETIKVTAGEFETKAVEGALERVMPALIDRIVEELCGPGNNGDRYGAFWSEPYRATMITAPGVATARALAVGLSKDVPAVLVTGDVCESHHPLQDVTPITRQDAFKKVTNREAILVQVNVVSEGVDLPIRVHVDCAPTMSPVRWMQRVGRGTRPTGVVCYGCGLCGPSRQGGFGRRCPECMLPHGLQDEGPPVYICTNHNIARHAYLWAGVLPSSVVRGAQAAWGPDFKPSRRLLARAIGLEGFGKFTVSQVPLLDGSHLSLYALQTPDGQHQYAVLLHACVPDPMFFQRTNPYTGETAEKTLDNGMVVVYKKRDYGPWKKIAGIPSLEGYVSTKPGPVTPKMAAWWARSAASRGLDAKFVPNNREFQALPILMDTRTVFRLEETC